MLYSMLTVPTFWDENVNRESMFQYIFFLIWTQIIVIKFQRKSQLHVTHMSIGVSGMQLKGLKNLSAVLKLLYFIFKQNKLLYNKNCMLLINDYLHCIVIIVFAAILFLIFFFSKTSTLFGSTILWLWVYQMMVIPELGRAH